MLCPHCRTKIHSQVGKIDLGIEKGSYWRAESQNCPACGRLIIEAVDCRLAEMNGMKYAAEEKRRFFVNPRVASRPSPQPEVDAKFAKDYVEASLVLSDSPKASAALSRRCLQHVLREKAGVKRGDLAKEIEDVIASNKLPTHLAEAIDAIRNIGNFAAHPIKSTSTGEVVDVEPGEAEWTLDVLEGLFDFYFVQPAVLRKKRDALNVKLADAKKPPVK